KRLVQTVPIAECGFRIADLEKQKAEGTRHKAEGRQDQEIRFDCLLRSLLSFRNPKSAFRNSQSPVVAPSTLFEMTAPSGMMIFSWLAVTISPSIVTSSPVGIGTGRLSRKRSASMAAMQPVPAAVTA